MIRENRVVTFVVGIPVSCDCCAFVLSRCKTHGSVAESPRHENGLSQARHLILQALNLHDETERLKRNNDRTHVSKPMGFLAYLDAHRVAVVDDRKADLNQFGLWIANSLPNPVPEFTKRYGILRKIGTNREKKEANTVPFR